MLKHHEFHVLNVHDNTDNFVGVVKFATDLRVVDDYFQVLSPEDHETVIGVRTDKVPAYRLVPITEEVNHNAT